jgi:hypothetical protein
LKSLARISFEAPVIEWRGPAPFFFAALPEEYVGEVRYAARLASYGWGCVPVTVTIGDVDFTTSLFPRDGTYLVPLKAEARRRCGIALGDRVAVTITIKPTER